MSDASRTDGFSRRTAVFSAATSGLALFAASDAEAQSKPADSPAVAPSPTAPADAHAVQPLRFNPKGLRGLSEKLLTSHHDNNYAGAVKNLNRTQEELSRVTKDTPPFVVGGLKQNELSFRNSATFHELYFSNLGGDGRATGSIEKTLAAAFGSFNRWETLFRATGASLAGGSGWVVTAYDLHRDTVFTFWSGQHAQAAVSNIPLLVMDMYEHSYALDYGAAAAKYIDAFFANIQWDEVSRRHERAQKAAQALKAG
jgi:superoxide dismutase, Fe-Mn family